MEEEYSAIAQFTIEFEADGQAQADARLAEAIQWAIYRLALPAKDKPGYLLSITYTQPQDDPDIELVDVAEGDDDE